jgi:hypothetical protein
VREQPTAARWGAARQLESEYFIFHYHALDEEAVRQVYWRPPTGEKLTIAVDPTHERGVLDHLRSQEPGIVVASPSATLAPAALAASDLLLQSLVIGLYDQLAVNTITKSCTFG